MGRDVGFLRLDYCLDRRIRSPVMGLPQQQQQPQQQGIGLKALIVMDLVRILPNFRTAADAWRQLGSSFASPAVIDKVRRHAVDVKASNDAGHV